ncbi:FAD-dependent oxidoreductase [Dyella sedimenti]|uniref:FAD-dependent oxidoreductase n=1 Tax=Dyella sedimenti TaxID=2919947 RepID=UPI001FAA7519|nr:FAD-dependent monooxygenase [Dyella sedimenti]
MASPQVDVLIVGAGPTGLAAALLLARRGVAVRIVDGATEPNVYSKALAVNSRTLEVLQETGVADRIVVEGWAVKGASLHERDREVLALDLPAALGVRQAMTVLPQARTEALLADALQAQGVTVERGATLLALAQDESRVTATLRHADGRQEQAQSRLLFGADGARSATRHALRLDFAGSNLPEPWLLWDIGMQTPLDPWRAHVLFEPAGFIFVLRLAGATWRVIGNTADPLATLRRYGTLDGVAWQSQFHIGHRVAARAGVGRVALGGDAAHIHSPIGARGMNLGIEDAYVFADCAADALAGDMARLRDYAVLRHAVHRSVVRRIGAITRLVHGRTPWLRRVRDGVIPLAGHLSFARELMLRTVGGLDHPLKVHP